MSIRSISSSTPGLGLPAYARPGGGRRGPTRDPSILSLLTAEDRDLAAAVFGRQILTEGVDGDGRTVGVPVFVWLVAEDRRDGRLPAGSEITRTYLREFDQRRRDDPGPPALTPEQTSAAATFLGRRWQGATVDIRA